MFSAPGDETGQSIVPIVQDIARQNMKKMVFIYCDIEQLPITADKYGVESLPQIYVI